MPARSVSPSGCRIWRSGREAPRARGGWGSSTVSVEPSALLERTGNRPGRGGTRHDILGRDEPAQPLAQLRQDGRAVGVGETVRLVEDDDRPLSLADQGGERLVLGADQVVVEDEDQQVGARRQVAGFALTRSRRPRRSPTSPACPSGRRSRRRPRARTCGSRPLGRAHDRLGLAGFAPEQCIDQRGLARRARSEDDDVELAAALAGPEVGQLLVQSDLGRRVLDLADDGFSMVRLNGRRLDDVVRRLELARPRTIART